MDELVELVGREAIYAQVLADLGNRSLQAAFKDAQCPGEVLHGGALFTHFLQEGAVVLVPGSDGAFHVVNCVNPGRGGVKFNWENIV